MAMILDAFMSKVSALLAERFYEEVIMLLGVNDEHQKLRELMVNIQHLLNDAEKKRFNESSSTELWLSKLKDVMYDAEDIIDLCSIKGTQLLHDQNSESKTSSVRCNFSHAFSCFTGVPLRHEIGNKIKDINKRLNKIYEDRQRFSLEKSTISKTPQFTVPSRKTSPLPDSFVVGREVDEAANSLVDRLVGEKVDENCSVFAVTGMGGIGKTTLARKIFNHQKIQTYFNKKVWVCISETYLETELLKEVIRGVNGTYGDANTKAELEPILRDSVASGQSLFLTLDDVWRGNVWDELLRVPLHQSNVNVKVLVTTRYENVAKEMKAEGIHHVNHLSDESGWDMLCRRLFSEKEDKLAIDLKEIGLEIVKKCKGLPLAVKVIAGVLVSKERTRPVWQTFLRNDAWSISKLPEELRGAMYLSFEDLPSHLKQCFLYFSLYAEDGRLIMQDFPELWVAEGFITNQQGSLMEDLAKECFNELLNRNLLLPEGYWENQYKMHDLVRYLAIFLSKEESSFGASNLRNSTTSIKLRRLSVANQKAAAEILDSVAYLTALRTLLASYSDLLLDDERLRQLSHLRVLDISHTKIKILPNSIGELMHLRYLKLNNTDITAIPESIGQLMNLQFFYIRCCEKLKQLPSGITLLHSLRLLDIFGTPLCFIPKGIEKLQQLNYLSGFVVANNDSNGSKLEELNSLKEIRVLNININGLTRPQSKTIILKELPNLSTLTLDFDLCFNPNDEKHLAVEELFDNLIPPISLENFKIYDFFGHRFPNWMVSSSIEICLPKLTKLKLSNIRSCTQLPPLGMLPELRELEFFDVEKVKKIGPEFFCTDVNSTRTAFPKLELLKISSFDELEEWSFGEQVEQSARLPCLQKLEVSLCSLLKQLPEDLKYSPMKFLNISNASNLKSLDNLPAEIEELILISCGKLEKVCCPPSLKKLEVRFCYALAYVKKFDSLQKLIFCDHPKKSLPKWLLNLLQQRGLQNDSNDDFHLELVCQEEVFQGCLKGGIYWNLIQHIPHVYATLYPTSKYYLRYSKQSNVYETNLDYLSSHRFV